MDVEEAYAHYANGYLVKPVGFGEMVQVLSGFSDRWLKTNRGQGASLPTG